MDHSQSGEQAFIETLPETGRFLDIGAADGLTFSNTKLLAERGWTGVCVEPAAWAFDQLLKNMPDQVTCVNVVLGEYTGLVPFHYSNDFVSTTDPLHRARWEDRVDFHQVYAMQLAVDEFMRHFPPPYDMVSADTEGTSLYILGLLKPYLHGTKMVVVEDDGHQVELDGFEVLTKTANNTILARKP